MSKIDNFDECIKSDKKDLSDYLLDEATDIIKFIETDFPRIAKNHDITPQNLGEHIINDIYGKYLLSSTLGPAKDFFVQLTARLKILSIRYPKSLQDFGRDDEQLIHTMEEISELSFGGGHELKTLVRIIYLIQQIIAKKNSSIKVGHIPHKVVNGLFIDFPEQFPCNSFKTNAGINVIELRFDCRFSGHNIRLMKTFKSEIQRVIRGEYDIIQTSVLYRNDSSKSYITCPYKDIIGIYNHFIATDEITDKTYNHILNNAFLFMNILPIKKGNSWEFHSLNDIKYRAFNEKNDVMSKDVKKKSDYLINILNSKQINIPKHSNDSNYMIMIQNNEFDFKFPRYINNTRISLSNNDNKVEFRFYDFITDETYDVVYSEIFCKNSTMFMTNVGKILQTITKNKIINVNAIPKEIMYNIILSLIRFDKHANKDQNTSVSRLLDELMTCDVLNVNIIYYVLTYIKSSLGNQFLGIIKENALN